MFDEDIVTGKKGEKIADAYLREKQKALDVFWVNGQYPEFDAIALFPRGKLRTIELKTDLKEAETHNIAIETKHRGYFSGILVSQADWYIILLKNKLLCMKKRDLFYFLRENQFKEIEWCDDKSQILLVPTDELIASGICDIYDYHEHKTIEKTITYLHEV